MSNLIKITLCGVVIAVLLALAGCGADGGDLEPSATGSSFVVGRATIISNSTEHEPSIHHLHSAMHTNGALISGSGIPFEIWLDNNLSTMPEIQFSSSLKVVVEGEYGQIVTYQHQNPMYHNGLRLIGIPAENFVNKVASISLPSAAGVYLVYVDVGWSEDDTEFTLLRYVFKIVK